LQLLLSSSLDQQDLLCSLLKFLFAIELILELLPENLILVPPDLIPLDLILDRPHHVRHLLLDLELDLERDKGQLLNGLIEIL
jgi:hypothetical protein